MRQGQVRIIAGKWRGRRLPVPDLAGLRPTPDRVRETLFNWLATEVAGARCLDLFAGSGALGIEALSRGAAYVELVDKSRDVVESLQTSLREFGAENARVYQASVPKQLQTPAQPFDIVFLDPPYQSDLLLPCLTLLVTHDYLAEGALIYLETDSALTAQQLPDTLELIKAGHAGQVYYHLAKNK